MSQFKSPTTVLSIHQSKLAGEINVSLGAPFNLDDPW